MQSITFASVVPLLSAIVSLIGLVFVALYNRSVKREDEDKNDVWGAIKGLRTDMKKINDDLLVIITRFNDLKEDHNKNHGRGNYGNHDRPKT